MFPRSLNGGTFNLWINFNHGWEFHWSPLARLLAFCRSARTHSVCLQSSIFVLRNRSLSPQLLQFRTLGFTSAQKSTPPNSKPAYRNCVRHRKPWNMGKDDRFDLTRCDRHNFVQSGPMIECARSRSGGDRKLSYSYKALQTLVLQPPLPEQ